MFQKHQLNFHWGSGRIPIRIMILKVFRSSTHNWKSLLLLAPRVVPTVAYILTLADPVVSFGHSPLNFREFLGKSSSKLKLSASMSL